MVYVLAIVQCSSRHFFTVDLEKFHIISYRDHLYHDNYIFISRVSLITNCVAWLVLYGVYNALCEIL